MLYLLFFLSGLSGLVYQVVWVRTFGNVFGNTIYSASLVVAVFMLGLGVGGYVVGAWADRRYAARPDSLLRAYGYAELVIAALGLAISLLLPHLGVVSAAVSSYVRDPQGWYVLSAGSYAVRVLIAVVMLAPITLLMGGTLTLLIRHLVRRDVAGATPRIAVLYAVNTAGAALGCLLTDFSLVPAFGLLNTQFLAVALNVVAGVGALWIGSRHKAQGSRHKAQLKVQASTAKFSTDSAAGPGLVPVAAALALIGFAALGLEILWFRHFTIMLGQFRAVFSLLLAIVLVGIGAGALAAGAVQRRTMRPAVWLAAVQALFVVTALLGLALADAGGVDAAIADPATQSGVGAAASSAFAELWFNARPMLLEVALPALLMGFSFPLANAVVQRAERSVGRYAGTLYLANTAGAVAGSLVTGFVLLPVLGMQAGATVLAVAAAGAIVPLIVSGQRAAGGQGRGAVLTAGGWLLTAAAAIAIWVALPAGHVIARALPRPEPGNRLLTVDEGVNEVIGVTESPGRGRVLMTNGHPMSATDALSQRYMRALAHVPLLSMEAPRRVLVIGFGVGNTTHAATLHPSVERVDLADLSRDVLAHAPYFSEFNKGVLGDPRLQVHINDGRQHLLMTPEGSYDLITLEPPPIAYAGVAALYSREFYALARTRLRPGGYLSQWLPALQVPEQTNLSMVRAFIDVFPQGVLLSGATADLLLVGARDAAATIDPPAVAARLARAPAVQSDLDRLDLGTVTEIVGTFLGSAQTLAAATQGVAPVTDDRPLQEYSVLSLLDFGDGVPPGLVDLEGVSAWCPACFVDGRPVPLMRDLEPYMALLRRAYTATADQVQEARALSLRDGRRIAGSAYLGAVVPESSEVRSDLGLWLAMRGDLQAATQEFRRAVALDPASALAHWHLGAALASTGQLDEAEGHLRRALELDPAHADARSDLEAVLRLKTARARGSSN